jgi:hypothetical protein
MRVLRVWAALALLFLGYSAQAHTVPLELTVTVRDQKLVLLARTTTGAEIQGAVFEYQFVRLDGGQQGNQAISRISGVFLEAEPAIYKAVQPKIAAGVYRFVVRDRTFAGEMVEVAQELRWPAKSWELKLPAAKGNSQQPLVLLLVVLGIPVVAGLAVLVWAIRQPAASNMREASPISSTEP